jgi:spermidine/putrescine transport system substrate-binding protein
MRIDKDTEEEMHKLAFLFIAALLIAALPAAAEDELEPWVCPEGFEGQTLSVYNWSTYIAEDTVANFEAACGVTVIYDVYESNEALLARIRQGNPGYDIAVPTDYVVSIMIDEGLVQPLDFSLIPNVIHLDEDFLDTPFDPGNEHSLPYLWGTIGIGYNITRVGAEITTWEEMFTYDGPVAWLEDLRGMIGIALNQLGLDPNTGDPDEIAQARDFLIANGSNVVVIAADDGQALLERGEVHMAVEYSGDIFQLIDDCECDDFVYVIPEEGAIVWVDNLVILTGARNPTLAHIFLDYLMHPQVAADIANYTAYGSPNQTAIELGLIDPDLLADPGIYPSPEVEERLFYIVDVPEAEVFYNNAWDEIKVLLGQ